MTEQDVPSQLTQLVENKRHELIEAVANVDEELGEMFLSDQMPTPEQLKVHPIISYIICTGIEGTLYT